LCFLGHRADKKDIQHEEKEGGLKKRKVGELTEEEKQEELRQSRLIQKSIPLWIRAKDFWGR